MDGDRGNLQIVDEDLVAEKAGLNSMRRSDGDSCFEGFGPLNGRDISFAKEIAFIIVGVRVRCVI